MVNNPFGCRKKFRMSRGKKIAKKKDIKKERVKEKQLVLKVHKLFLYAH